MTPKLNKEDVRCEKLGFLTPIRKLLADDEAAAMVEYALLVSFIALACAVALIPFGNELKDVFEEVSEYFEA